MDIQKMMREAEKMQKEMEDIKTEINKTIFTSTQGSVVTVEMFGSKVVKDVKIEQEALEDVEMLQDLVLLAINNCGKEIDEYTREKMGVFNQLGGLI